MSKSKPSLPRGTRDFGPEVSAKRNYIIGVIKEQFKKYCFSQLETPSMENLSVLTGKYGEEGDQLLFKILNSGDFLNKATAEDFNNGSKSFLPKVAEKGLRYDLTVPFARFVVMNQNDIAFPFKRFQIQPVWRADKPQKGRYREFYQCDADIIGSKTLWNEAELTFLINDVFEKLNLNDYVIKINHREILFRLAEYVGLKGNEIPFCAEIDKIDKIGSQKVLDNIVGIGADSGKSNELLSLFEINDRETLLSKVTELVGKESKGIQDLLSYFESIGQFGKELKVELDLSLARGLSYYTGIIFEVKPTSVQMGSICGGGRYDDLTGIFGLPDVSGVGISFGLDRIYDVLGELDLFPDAVGKSMDVLIVHFNEETRRRGQEMVIKLRSEGIKAELYPEQVKIKKQFNYADRVGAPQVIVIGEDELKSGVYALKNMQTGEQQKADLSQIISHLTKEAK